MKPPRGFYAILDVADGLEADLEAARARANHLILARPCCLQLRAKTASASELLELSRAVLPLARGASVPLCINDRLDVALIVGADAVHLGQDDLPLSDARRLAGGRLAIGVSTHNRAQAQAAIAGGADYIGVGPIFATRTKRNPDAVVGLDGLAEICARSAIAVVAIGGITVARAVDVAAAGAAAAALIAAIEDASDASAAGLLVNAAFVSG